MTQEVLSRINLPLPSVPFGGDFSVFGYWLDGGEMERRFRSQLGAQPKSVCLGNMGKLYFYSSYGDVAEDQDVIALKLGFLRSADGSPLSSRKLLENSWVGAGSIQSGCFAGNALVVCLQKDTPNFTAYKSLLGVPQLYYYQSAQGVLCSDRLSCLLKLLGPLELNEDAIPMHFLFRSVPGEGTYYRGIRRLMPGQLAHWKQGTQVHTRISTIQDWQQASAVPAPVSLERLDAAFDRVVGDYIRQAKAAGAETSTLLSGGVELEPGAVLC